MSDLTLVIGNKNYSSWSLRPWVFLKHHDIPFTEKWVSLFTDTTKEALAPYQSNFKVPILQDDGFNIWDSLAILEYIAEQYPQTNAWPQGTQARAFARAISYEIHASFVHIRSEMPMNCRKQFHQFKCSDDAQNEVERIKELWRQCRAQFGQDGQWLFGHYSITDAMFAPIALRFSGYGVPLDGIEAAYVQSVLHQPAIIEWIHASKAEKETISQSEIKT